MKSDMLVSFCVPTYNQESFVAEALESIFKQTYPHVELIVIDDCSTDNTATVIANTISRYFEAGGCSRVAFVRNDHNLGIVKNYEKAFLMAKGSLLIDAGGDDVQEPERAAVVARAFQASNGNVSAIVHSGVRISIDGKYINDIGRRGLVHSALGCVTCYRRDVVDKFPRISEDWAWEDVVFGYRASLLGETIYLSDKLVRRRVGAGASTAKLSKRKVLLRFMNAAISARRQRIIDISWLNAHRPLPNFEQLSKNIRLECEQDCAAARLLSEKSFLDRYDAWRKLKFLGAEKKRLVYMAVFLFPVSIADAIFYFYVKLKKIIQTKI